MLIKSIITKKAFGVLLALSVFIGLVACDDSESIKINGEASQTIEVGINYVDEGATFPQKYTMIKTGEVDFDKLGTYEIKYSFFTSKGELVKELSRFVYVVDTQAPTYIGSNKTDFYVGINYTINDFLESYSDNYDNMVDLSIIHNDLSFKDSGSQDIQITITDTSLNESVFFTKIDVQLDFFKLIDYVNKDQTYNITKGTTGAGSSYVFMSIDSNRTLSYNDSGALNYKKLFSSEFGRSSSITISAQYGEFSSARLNYLIWGSTTSQYSVGYTTFDATKCYDSLTFTEFDSCINYLNLNETDMINEMNPRVLEVLNEFTDFVENTLGVDFK